MKQKEYCPICKSKLQYHKGVIDFEFFHCKKKIDYEYHYLICIRKVLVDHHIETVIIPPFKITNDLLNNKYTIIKMVYEGSYIPSLHLIYESAGSIEINEKINDRIKKLIIFS